MAQHDAEDQGAESARVGRHGDEPIGQMPGEFVETVAGAAGMAADLPPIEHQRKRIGQQPDHRQHHQSRALVDGGMFEVTIGGDGLRHFGINAPPTAAKLMDEGC